MPPPPPEEALEQADMVFVGTVEAFGEDDTQDHVGEEDLVSARQRTATVRITASWKGVEQERLSLRVSPRCGFPFEVGREYLIYARRGAFEEPQVSLCSRTTLLAQADDELDVLSRQLRRSASSTKSGEPDRLLVPGAFQGCQRDDECIALSIECGGCDCAFGAIHAAHAAAYQQHVNAFCHNWFGDHCETVCPPQRRVCREGRCALTAPAAP